MNRQINKIKLFANDNDKSKSFAQQIKSALITKGFQITDKDFELGIAIGGDGSFLRMVKNTNFNSDIYYIGINTGTLGFTQEIDIEHIDDFIDGLHNNQLQVDNIGIQETIINYDNKTAKFCSLNEIVMRDAELNTAIMQINIDNIELEKFIGDGLLIATSFGSTAYNLSFGGSIVYNSLHTLQITPIAPLNSRCYRNLLNSVIVPENTVITIIPNANKNNLLITVDGENYTYNKVERIETAVKNKRIKCLRTINSNFTKKINEKFLK